MCIRDTTTHSGIYQEASYTWQLCLLMPDKHAVVDCTPIKSPKEAPECEITQFRRRGECIGINNTDQCLPRQQDTNPRNQEEINAISTNGHCQSKPCTHPHAIKKIIKRTIYSLFFHLHIITYS